MAKRRWFLIAAIGLAGLWTGWLIYLVATTAKPIVVSQPQLDVSPVIVEARLPAQLTDATEVIITHVHRGHLILSQSLETKAGKEQKIGIVNLRGIRGWQGSGDYILALQPGDGMFRVASIPPSPGFMPPANADRDDPVIYPATPATRRQLESALRAVTKQ